MVRESRRPDATPTRRASSAEPLVAVLTSRRSLLRTPGSQARGLPRSQGISAAATPHARAAFRAIDSRRAAILTPHRARRRSVREVRDSPRNFLLSLGRVLARTTEVITTSSSSSPGGDADRTHGSDSAGNDTTLGPIRAGDEDDDEELPKRPRLSLPIGDEDEDDDDSDDLQPHRSVLFDDENFTMQSIEMPRRALSEQPGGRFSLGSTRMSDYFNTNDLLHSEDIGVDSGFFPPTAMLDDANITMGVEELASPERLDVDDQRNRESDFEFEIPVGEVNESTFMLAAQVQESPDRPPVAEDEPMYDDYAPLVDQRSDDFDEDLGDVPALEDEPTEQPRNGALTEPEPVTARRAEARGPTRRIRVSKYGIEYPSLPPTVVRRLAQNFAKASGGNGKITPDAMKAIMQASDWFFEQLGEDLQAYANHAGRKTIDESDVLTLMKRQRQINPSTTLFSLAQRHLPRELLQELRMPPPVVPKKRRKAKGGAEDDDVT